MVKFEILGKDKEDLKSKLAANFKEDASELVNHKAVSNGINELVDALPEPKAGCVISARVKLNLVEGEIHIHMDTFASTVLSPMGGVYHG